MRLSKRLLPLRARGFLFSLLLVGGLAASSHAELQQAELKVDGLACPFCAYGLEKKLKKLEGVAKIDVDIKRGRVSLMLKKKSPLTIASLQKAVKKAGFTLREVDIQALGTFQKGFFVIKGTKEKLKPYGKTKAAQGLVRVTGKVVLRGSKRPQLILKKFVSLRREEKS